MIDAWYDIHGLLKIHVCVSEKNSARTVDRLLSSFKSDKLDKSQLQLEFFDAIEHKPDKVSLNAGGIFYSESDHMVWDSHGSLKSGPNGKLSIYSDKGIDKFVLTLLLTIQLARHQLAICHAMGIVIDGKAILFPAWKRTGKTGLFNYFAQMENVGVLGDELMIISGKGDVYKLPYPLIIQHYHATDKPTALGKAYKKKRNIYLGYTIDPFFNYVAKPIVNSLSVVSPALVRLIKRNAPERGVTTPLEDIIPAEKIVDYAKLEKVINLVRSSGSDIEIKEVGYKVIVPEILSMLYQGELFSSPGVERFLQYWLVLNAFNEVESWQSILSKVEYILEQTLQSVQCYRLTMPQRAPTKEIGKYLEAYL